ncbi:MAG: hypothetical protein CVU77_06460 [Elusimicrobia bacterium HGW-Elusimicrobia-1]|jgi:hypothetical protein|nr:MAG: hypothetical protein CVU77_06460 [Elusimicrobia bacterium HGW-Elusimicrobia-1]
METKTQALNRLFTRWIRTYPQTAHDGFHRDGIIAEREFARQPNRILFVLAEPNSTGGRFVRYRGADLRKVFGEEKLNKPLTRNLGLWTQMLLDGSSRYHVLSPSKSQVQIRRIAIMNLKKFSGSGKADYAGIGLHAWHDRAFIRRQVAIISPNLIITCGERIHKVFGAVMHDNRFWSTETSWKWNVAPVENVQHPATRGRNTLPAFRRLREIARKNRVLTTCSSRL